MTVGSYAINRLKPYGAILSGEYYTKTWSGGDRPKVDYARDPVWWVSHADTGKYLDSVGRNVPRRRVLSQHEQEMSFYRRTLTRSRPPKRSLDVFHDYTMTESSNNKACCVFNNGETTTGVDIRNGQWGTFVCADYFNANDQIKLVNKLKEKIQGSDFNLALVLAEGNQVLNMIAGNAMRVAKSIHHLRKGDVSGSIHSLVEGTDRKVLPRHKSMRKLKDRTERNLSRHWLELQYGWLPLLGDTEAGAKFLAHKLSAPIQNTYRVRSQARVARTVASAGGQVGNTVTWVDTHERRIRAVIAEHPSAMQSLGLLDPFTIAWELLPYSFVIDWFIPIGSYLEARGLSSTVQGTFYTSNSRFCEGSGVAGRSGNAPYLPNRFVGGAGSPWSKHLVFSRVASSSLAVPMPSVKPLAKAASWMHCANAIALLVGGRPPVK